MDPVEAIPDALRPRRGDGVHDARVDGIDTRVELPARTVLVAAGTAPNVTYEKEHPGSFELDGKARFFKGFRGRATAAGGVRARAPTRTASSPPTPATAASSATTATTTRATTATSSRRWPRPSTATARRRALRRRRWRHWIRRRSRPAIARWQALVARLDDQLLARVERVIRLTPTIIEVIVRAPAAARHFHPGQFYRLQNFERGSVRVHTDDHVAALLMEGIALTGAWVDREARPAVAHHARDGRVEPAVRLPAAGRAGGGDGPDRDTRPRSRHYESVLLAGGGLGNAVLFSIARALKAPGSRVLYFAGYRDGADLFKREEIEAATDQVVWATDSGVADRAAAARRTATSAATSSRRWSPTPRAGSASGWCR